MGAGSNLASQRLSREPALLRTSVSFAQRETVCKGGRDRGMKWQIAREYESGTCQFPKLQHADCDRKFAINIADPRLYLLEGVRFSLSPPAGRQRFEKRTRREGLAGKLDQPALPSAPSARPGRAPGGTGHVRAMPAPCPRHPCHILACMPAPVSCSPGGRTGGTMRGCSPQCAKSRNFRTPRALRNDGAPHDGAAGCSARRTALEHLRLGR
eukprot:gene5193-biopygen20672